MAVPGRRNGLMEEDDNDVVDGMLEEQELEDGLPIEDDTDVPAHLRDLASSASSGDLVALRLALDNLDGSSSIDEPVEDGDTALHLSCLYGHLPCVHLLLERGACLEVKDEDGAIPLHDACAGGYTEIARLLIDSAADANCLRRMLEAVDIENDTPLHHAARGEHADVIKLLLEHGASATKKNNNGEVPGELADPDTEASKLLEAAGSGDVLEQ
ncbi:hypothetical protein Nepgr_032031 [Nepenthes gracilis]|uniref:Uncharacterized protein n=1 Tax=Nepenthes gracilis TaxID=150966 RepID=A0AAD3TJQ1_NEPGR|nr:hypothetical protein Nepgr_032031 [Nepenthes gracilis]